MSFRFSQIRLLRTCRTTVWLFPVESVWNLYINEELSFCEASFRFWNNFGNGIFSFLELRLNYSYTKLFKSECMWILIIVMKSFVSRNWLSSLYSFRQKSLGRPRVLASFMILRWLYWYMPPLFFRVNLRNLFIDRMQLLKFSSSYPWKSFGHVKLKF